MLRMVSEIELVEFENSTIFRCESEQEPDMCCEVISADVLPKPSGRLVKTALDTRLYQEERELFLEAIERKNETLIFLAKYTKDVTKKMQLWGVSSEYPHTARTQEIWPAMDLSYQLLKHGVLLLHSTSIDVNGIKCASIAQQLATQKMEPLSRLLIIFAKRQKRI